MREGIKAHMTGFRAVLIGRRTSRRGPAIRKPWVVSIVGFLLVVLSACEAPIAVLATASAPVIPTSPPTQYSFAGMGFGHGVGLSQYGTKNRADAGMNFAQILDAYYPGTAVGSVADIDPLRVAIRDREYETLGVHGQADVFAAGQLLATVSEAPMAFARSARSLSVVTGSTELCASVDCAGGVSIVPKPGSWFAVGGVPYQHGSLEVRPAADDPAHLLMIVVGIALEDYLLGIAEVPYSWPTAALQTQAVAARSYAVAKTVERRRPGSGWAHPFDLWATTADQVYAGDRHLQVASGNRWVNGVTSTAGKVLTYNGAPVVANYSSSNGGHSEHSENVWSKALPYLRGAPDPFDAAGNPRSSWLRVIDAATMSRYLGRFEDTKVGKVAAITIGTSPAVSGRVDRAPVTITGDGGVKTVTGARFRVVLNDGIRADGGRTDRLLLSTKFVMTPVTSVSPAAG